MSRDLRNEFSDEALRRQWESSIGIIHSTSKESMVPSTDSRLYLNPLKERADVHRPVSPLLNLDEDRMNMDEYADVAGHFFSDVMPVTVPSRGAKRPLSKKQQQIPKNKIIGEKFYAQTAYLPRLKGCKQVRTKLQNETLSTNVEVKNMKRLSTCKSGLRSDGKRTEESFAFDRNSLFDDEITICLNRFDHSAYAMIPGKLYKYEDTVDSSDLKDNSVADLFIPYNIAMMYLKITVIEILFGKNTLQKRQFQKAVKKMRIWVYEDKTKKWTQLVTENTWTHAKLLAQESSSSLRIMYSLRYKPGLSSDSTVAGSSFCSTTIASQDITDVSDEYSLLSDDFSGPDLDEEMKRTSANLSRLDCCHTPNPPAVDVRRGGSMLMLKDNEAKSSIDEIPKEQFMANILESRLMKSRY